MMTNDDLEQLITQYGKDIYSFCIHLTQNTDMADDLYQEVFLVASRRRRIVSASEKPKEYLLSVAVHTWTNMKRKYARRLSIVPEISYAGEKAVIRVAVKEEGQLVISVKNPVNETVEIENNRVIKEYESGHGIGLLNVEETAEKYDGSFGIYCDCKVFTATVVI